MRLRWSGWLAFHEVYGNAELFMIFMKCMATLNFIISSIVGVS